MLTDVETFSSAPPPAPGPPNAEQWLLSGSWLTIDVGMLQVGTDASWRRWVKQCGREERWIAWWRTSGYRRLTADHPPD